MTQTKLLQSGIRKDCNYCEGKGYIEIRDCTGEVQREETCVFCNGTGEIEDNKE